MNSLRGYVTNLSYRSPSGCDKPCKIRSRSNLAEEILVWQHAVLLHELLAARFQEHDILLGLSQRSGTATGSRTRDCNRSVVLSDAHPTARRGGCCVQRG